MDSSLVPALCIWIGGDLRSQIVKCELPQEEADRHRPLKVIARSEKEISLDYLVAGPEIPLWVASVSPDPSYS